MADRPFSSALLWPWLAAASAGRVFTAAVDDFASHAFGLDDAQTRPPPDWMTPNEVALELTTMRLRDFSSKRAGPPTLICAPLALHGATVADFFPGHSIVEQLRAVAGGPVFVTDWRSATPDMRDFSVDSYLAELNIAIDEIGPPVNLVGICQGGWMALLFAARFPAKLRRLAIAGAPVDINAGASDLSRMAIATPLEAFDELVSLGGGRMMGRRLREMWTSPRPDSAAIRALLEVEGTGAESDKLEARFCEWDSWTLDLPGRFYLQVVDWLFKQNRLVKGSFVALGRPANLKDIQLPVYLLAGLHDDLVAPEQLFATARRIGTPRDHIEVASEPCGHLGLFMGARTVPKAWSRIGRWLRGDGVWKSGDQMLPDR